MFLACDSLKWKCLLVTTNHRLWDSCGHEWWTVKDCFLSRIVSFEGFLDMWRGKCIQYFTRKQTVWKKQKLDIALWNRTYFLTSILGVLSPRLEPLFYEKNAPVDWSHVKLSVIGFPPNHHLPTVAFHIWKIWLHMNFTTCHSNTLKATPRACEGGILCLFERGKEHFWISLALLQLAAWLTK